MNFLSKNLEDTAKIAKDFASKLKPQERATVVGLYGELGSGKTTFMKFLAAALGVSEEIKSPTFVIMKSFKLAPSAFQTLIHIDAYRLDSGADLLGLGWRDIVSDPKNLVCIEWPEKVAEILPPHVVLKFEHAGETERKISIA